MVILKKLSGASFANRGFEQAAIVYIVGETNDDRLSANDLSEDRYQFSVSRLHSTRSIFRLIRHLNIDTYKWIHLRGILPAGHSIRWRGVDLSEDRMFMDYNGSCVRFFGDSSFIFELATHSFQLLDDIILPEWGDYAFGLSRDPIPKTEGNATCFTSRILDPDSIEMTQVSWSGSFWVSALYMPFEINKEFGKDLLLLEGEEVIQEVDAMGEGRTASEILRSLGTNHSG